MDNFYNLSKYIGTQHLTKFRICRSWANEIYFLYRDYIDKFSDPEEQILQCWKYFIHNTKEMNFYMKRNVLTSLIKNIVLQIKICDPAPSFMMISYFMLYKKPTSRNHDFILIVYNFRNIELISIENIHDITKEFKQLINF